MAAVSIVNGNKYYGSFDGTKRHILKGINLTVPPGSMYSLLGPSGCGKTTLLRCIVGRLQFSKGTVRTFGHFPGTKKSGIPGRRLGFMPQDIALTEELSISETLNYFGLLSGMSTAKISTRTEFLCKFLHIASLNCPLAKLSGGQKRRVSLAVALLHQPELLILDEPTVGIDPVLRNKIWNHLFELATVDGITIIIVTHYIEEARKSNIVALMTGGKILAEGNPDQLISELQVDTLEGAFLRLCYQDGAGQDLVNSDNKYDQSEKLESVGATEPLTAEQKEINCGAPPKENNGNSRKLSFDSPSCVVAESWMSKRKLILERKLWDIRCQCQPPRWTPLKAVFKKSCVKAIRHPNVIGFQLLLPFIVVSFMCYIPGYPIGNMPFGVVNRDSGVLGEQFLAQLDPYKIIQKDYSSLDEVRADFDEGLIIGVVTFPENFSNATLKRYKMGVLSNDEIINDSTMYLTLDYSALQMAAVVYQEFMEAFVRYSNETLHPMLVDTTSSELPLNMAPPVYGKTTDSTREFLTPGTLVCMGYLTHLVLTALTMVTEKKEGVAERDLIAGIRVWELTLGIMCYEMIIVFFKTIVLVIVPLYLFSIECHGSILLAMVILFFQGLAGMMNGMFLAALCDREITAVASTLILLFSIVFFTGTFWPIEALGTFSRYISITIFPHSLSVTALRDIFNRGWDLSHSSVLIGLLSSVAMVNVFLVLTVITLVLRK